MIVIYTSTSYIYVSEICTVIVSIVRTMASGKPYTKLFITFVVSHVYRVVKDLLSIVYHKINYSVLYHRKKGKLYCHIMEISFTVDLILSLWSNELTKESYCFTISTYYLDPKRIIRGNISCLYL